MQFVTATAVTADAARRALPLPLVLYYFWWLVFLVLCFVRREIYIIEIYI